MITYYLLAIVLSLLIFLLFVPLFTSNYLGTVNYKSYLKSIGLISDQRSGLILSVLLIVGFIIHFVIISDNHIILNYSIFYWIWNLQPPIVEEIIFRGVILSILLIGFPKVYAILISSVLFSLIHVLLGPLFVINAFIAGLIFVIIRLQTGSILPGVVVHYFVNSYFEGIWITLGILLLYQVYLLGRKVIQNKYFRYIQYPK